MWDSVCGLQKENEKRGHEIKRGCEVGVGLGEVRGKNVDKYNQNTL